jgi:formylglycine-generating enzyme required for sulfatase activity
MDQINVLKLIKIPAGFFWMGSKEGEGEANERPRHCVQITKDFYLGETEVTQKQWGAVTGDKVYSPNAPTCFFGIACTWEWIAGTGYPYATNMEEGSFIEELNNKHRTAGKTGTFRLPTEAEWEYAARAGTDTKYFFGDDESKLSTYAQYGFRDPGNVKTKKPNPWGLYDVYGNADEHVQDFYQADYYQQINAKVQIDPKGPTIGTIDPKQPDKGKLRVQRGGSTHTNTKVISSAYRNFATSKVTHNIGFRLAYDPSP